MVVNPASGGATQRCARARPTARTCPAASIAASARCTERWLSPVANASGTTTITVNVSDGTTSTPMSFNVTIQPAGIAFEVPRDEPILPAAIRYQTELAANAAALTSIGYSFDSSSLDEVSAGVTAL